MVTYQTQEQFQPQTNHIVPYSDTVWTDFFSIAAAVQGVVDHVAKLKSTKRTPEKHTQRAYIGDVKIESDGYIQVDDIGGGLRCFLDWLANRLPTAAIMDQYIAYLSTKRLRNGKIGLAASSIAAKYIPPVRLFLDKLYRQHVPLTNGADFLFVDQVRRNLLDAASVKPPAPDEKSDLPSLYRYGKRLTTGEIEKILNSFDLDNLHGIRNYAIMLVGFRTGMRIAEIRRMTLSNIKREGEHWGIRVRGKGNKYDPVPASDQVVKTIKYWVAAFNADLTDDDPRFIQDTDPVFQPLTVAGNKYKYGNKQGGGYYLRHDDPDDIRHEQLKGLSEEPIRSLIKRASTNAIGYKITAHDMRRTCAASARAGGMDTKRIQVLLRHSSQNITEAYIGEQPDLGQSIPDEMVVLNIQTI